MGRLAVFWLTLGAALALSHPAPLQADSNIATFAEGHPPAMKRAIHQAQTKLPNVLARQMNTQGHASSALSLKVAFEVSGGFENIWVDQIRKRDDVFSGKLANAPRYMQGKMLGSPVSFRQAQVIDWALADAKGRYFGHYTTRVILKDLPSDQAAQVKSILTPAPLPSGY